MTRCLSISAWHGVSDTLGIEVTGWMGNMTRCPQTLDQVAGHVRARLDIAPRGRDTTSLPNPPVSWDFTQTSQFMRVCEPRCQASSTRDKKRNVTKLVLWSILHHLGNIRWFHRKKNVFCYIISCCFFSLCVSLRDMINRIDKMVWKL